MTHRAILAALPLLAACASVPAPGPAASPQERFWAALSSHCGAAYEGRMTSQDARDRTFPQRRMVAHWAACSDDRVAIAFHTMDFGAADQPVWDRSRTWVVTRGADGLRLRHDHRHEDGSEDAVTQYGGTTGSAGTARVQDFPIDAETVALFEREGLAASLTNVWRIEVDPAGAPGAVFAYQLTRRNDPTRLFRVAFDATRPIDPPPPAWGHR